MAVTLAEARFSGVSDGLTGASIIVLVKQRGASWLDPAVRVRVRRVQRTAGQRCDASRQRARALRLPAAGAWPACFARRGERRNLARATARTRKRRSANGAFAAERSPRCRCPRFGRGLFLRLAEDTRVDVLEAQQLVGAARRCSDPSQALDHVLRALPILEQTLLPGLDRPWIEARRRHLADLWVDATEILAWASLELDDLTSAESAARSWSSAHRCMSPVTSCSCWR